MARRVQKRIVWKNDAVAGASETKKLRPVMRVIGRSDEHVFVPGQLFRLNVPMEPIPTYIRDQPPPFSYVTKSWYNSTRALHAGYLPQGSIAIFMGHTRVEEVDGTHVRSLLRATFLIEGRRYMPVDLNDLEPVS